MSERTRGSIGIAASVVLLLSFLGCDPRETGETTGTAGSRSVTVSRPARAEITEMMRAARIPGLSLAELRDGELVRVEVIGVADAASGEPVSEATLFEAASLSTPVFATIVLRLVERGEIDLDRPLVEYLVNERIDDPRGDRITARMVLSHRSGLPNWGGERLELAFDPGTAFNYSGEGYVYLQRVVEDLTGVSLDGARSSTRWGWNGAASPGRRVRASP